MNRFQLFVRVAALLSLLVTTIGCAPIAARPQSIHVEELHWKTEGGGQIEFSLVQNGADYDVTVTSFDFQERQKLFSITKESGEVYDAIGRVLASQDGIEVIRSNAPTGSWTTLTFKNRNDTVTYENIVISEELQLIYIYMAFRAE